MNEAITENNSDEDIIATEQDEDSLYTKGSLNEPDDNLKLFKKGELRDSKSYKNKDGTRSQNEDGTYRYPKKIIVTKALSQKGEDYYTVYAEIGCLWASDADKDHVVNGDIFIDGKKKSLYAYDNESYYGLTIKTKDEMKGATNHEDEKTPF